MLGYLLLWYKPFRLYCIRRLYWYIKDKEYSSLKYYTNIEYLCLFNNTNPLESLIIPCWKDIKEIKENRNSRHVNYSLSESFNCDRLWFDTNYNRLMFLRECLDFKL